MSKRVCRLCKAEDVHAKAIDGAGLRLRRDGKDGYHCADACARAERDGIDALGMRQRAAAAIAYPTAPTIRLRGGALACAIPASNARFWGNACRLCGAIGVALKGLGNERFCEDPIACITGGSYASD